jgi:hypothetical protein
MPSTYTLISSNVLSTTAASVTFSAIPATFTDLVVRWSARSDNTSVGVYVNFNANSANYSSRRLYADGATTYSDTHGSSAQNAIVAGVDISTFTANTFSSAELYIPSYTASQNKPTSAFSVTENNATTSWISVGANLWSNTAAITSIAFTTAAAGNFVSGSSFYLYGIKNS